MCTWCVRVGVRTGLLPQAHTCSNTLELPDYWTALQETVTADTATRPSEQLQLATEQALEELMLSKFLMAMGNFGGYGLD